MREAKISWGIVGTGSATELVLPAIKKQKEHTLTAVASRSAEKARRFAKKWDIPKAYGGYDRLLNDPDVSIVYMTLPNSMHAEWTIKAAKAGKHIFCEKPLALNAAQADAMIKAAVSANVLLIEAAMYRHHPVIIKIKALIENGEIGNLFLIRSTFNMTPKLRDNDTRLKPDMGGGSLYDVGYYPISFARYIVGHDPVEACGWRIVGNTGCDCAFVGQLKFPGNIFFQFNSSFIHPSRSPIELVGSEGTIQIECAFKRNASEEIIIIRENEVKKIFVQAERERFDKEIEELTGVVLHNIPQKVTHKESRGTAAALHALTVSAIEGRVVNIS